VTWSAPPPDATAFELLADDAGLSPGELRKCLERQIALRSADARSTSHKLGEFTVRVVEHDLGRFDSES
jgi:hypothetical protein